MKLFGEDNNCPIRMTNIMSFDELMAEQLANTLVTKFQWKIHSRMKLQSKYCTVYSILLFSLKGTLIVDELLPVDLSQGD